MLNDFDRVFSPFWTKLNSVLPPPTSIYRFFLNGLFFSIGFAFEIILASFKPSIISISIPVSALTLDLIISEFLASLSADVAYAR